MILNRFNETYIDRGSIKWMGMYLSEHTHALHIKEQQNNKRFERKNEMNFQQICEVVDLAIIKNKVVVLQTNDLNVDLGAAPFIEGKITGYDDAKIWIERVSVQFDSIKFIEIRE